MPAEPAASHVLIRPPSTGETLYLLRDPDFRRVWLIGALLGIMRWLEMVAIGVFVFDLTVSPLQVAVITAVRTLPLLFSPLAGSLGERFDRRILMASGLAAMTATSATLDVLVVIETIALWHLALGAFLGGLLWAMDMRVRRTVLGEIAGSDRLGSAMALDAATSHATRMLGPSLGGLLLDGIVAAMRLDWGRSSQSRGSPGWHRRH